MVYEAWYGISSLLLGVILFFPVRKLMLALNINRHQRKHQRAVTEEEREILRKKVTAWAALISVTFAFVYNKYLFVSLLGSLR